jgi:cold shock CspA family protein
MRATEADAEHADGEVQCPPSATLMPSVADADKLARLTREAHPLAQEFARASYDDRRELRNKCGIALPFLTLYLDSISMDDQPTFDGLEEDEHAKALKVAYHGTVRTWDQRKGYGFIAADDGTDALVHITCLRAGGFQTLTIGARVTFNRIVRDSGKAQIFRIIAIDPETEC